MKFSKNKASLSLTWALLAVFVLCFLPQITKAQEKVVDEIVGIVGSHPVYWSDVEAQLAQARVNGMTGDPTIMRCNIFEQLMFQKLLVNQAEIDSLVVSNEQVDGELDRRLRYYIQQFGSQQKLEEFYDKSINAFKDELREPLRQEILAQQAQGKIVENVKITPNETKDFFRKIPADSIPLIPTEYEIGEIVKKPVVGASQLKEAKEKLQMLRDRILKGEKFTTLAVLYSEDPGSATKSGELGFFGKGAMAPEFESAAFSLKNKGDISEIIKTKFGFHLLQLIERKGDQVNVRHILIIPKVSPDDLVLAGAKLDSISNLIRLDSITFEKAAMKFSDDPGKVNGGLMQSQNTGNTSLAADELDPKVFFVIDKMQPGEVSTSVPYTTEDGTQAYRLLYLKTRTTPHRANMKDDYNKIQEWALESKKQKAVTKWIGMKSKSAYIRIGERFRDCDFQYEWNARQ